MSSHSHLHMMEQAVIRNKWFTLVCVCALFGMFAYTRNIRMQQDFYAEALTCHQRAVDILSGSFFENTETDEPNIVTPAVWGQAKTHFNTCLLIAGINPARIPAYDDMFPYPNSGGTESYYSSPSTSDSADSQDYE